MNVTLSSGEEVQLRERGELTERLNRPVERAYARAVRPSQLLADMGYDAKKPETWDKVSDLSDEDFDRLESFKSAVIAAMVVGWPFKQEITEEGAMNLHPDVFNELADICNAAYRGDELDVDPDPLVSGGDSSDSDSPSKDDA
jgi:hypothetical protein